MVKSDTYYQSEIEKSKSFLLSYANNLLNFCKTNDEESLYQASQLSANYIRDGLGPDEIVAIHFDAVREVAADGDFTATDQVRVLSDAHQFLLEVMIGYGAQYKHFLDLKLQEALRRADTAERSEREKLELLAMIAHELGNPLTIALGNMQIAGRYLDGNDVTMIRALVSDAKAALERLEHLTSQIVTASRGDDFTLTIEPIDLLQPLLKAQGWARIATSEKRLSLEIPKWTEPLIVLGDQEAITSIINNLISNAIRYTPIGGLISLTWGYDAEWAWLSVSDTGIGIAPEEQLHVFEKFYRGPQAKRLEVHGLGLGLSIAARLAEAQLGSLKVESIPGQGSTFTLALPLSKSEMQKD